MLHSSLKEKNKKIRKGRGIVERNVSKHIKHTVSLLTFEKRKCLALRLTVLTRIIFLLCCMIYTIKQHQMPYELLHFDNGVYFIFTE